ncbi:MAG: type II toxin-antitoxin system Phd/YefM family antitoxin [Pleurocapsa sp. SU_196_0]|nr:type II toxin-antitoxin system Phd/YefM family antitoxin [Pleurocapsa sp. SU_196_0]
MQKTWALNDAKTQFSEVIERAQQEPQLVTKHGKNAAVVLSYEAYQKLIPTDNAWDALRPEHPVLEEEESPFERTRTIERPVNFDD